MKKIWLNLLLVCIGVVLGTLAAKLCDGVPALSFLGFGMDFGISEPLVLDLQVLTITFGLMLHINVATILFVILSLVIGRLLVKG